MKQIFYIAVIGLMIVSVILSSTLSFYFASSEYELCEENKTAENEEEIKEAFDLPTLLLSLNQLLQAHSDNKNKENQTQNYCYLPVFSSLHHEVATPPPDIYTINTL